MSTARSGDGRTRAVIEVSRIGEGDPLKFRVVLRDASGETSHDVTMRANLDVFDKEGHGKKKPLTVAGLKALKEEHGRCIAPLQTLAAEARGLEQQVAELVKAAYGLTPEEVALMWKTAPPRMPGEAPIR